jgi:hypothetical protein
MHDECFVDAGVKKARNVGQLLVFNPHYDTVRQIGMLFGAK